MLEYTIQYTWNSWVCTNCQNLRIWWPEFFSWIFFALPLKVEMADQVLEIVFSPCFFHLPDFWTASPALQPGLVSPKRNWQGSPWRDCFALDTAVFPYVSACRVAHILSNPLSQVLLRPASIPHDCSPALSFPESWAKQCLICKRGKQIFLFLFSFHFSIS